VAVERPVGLRVEQVDDRGEDVDRQRAIVAHLALRLRRRLDEQRSPKDLLSVVIGDPATEAGGQEARAVIGRDHDLRVVLGADALQLVDHLADGGLGRTDLEGVQLVPQHR
jgi:hypothetical protein